MFNLRDRLFRLSAFLQANIWIGDHRGISWLTAVSKNRFSFSFWCRSSRNCVHGLGSIPAIAGCQKVYWVAIEVFPSRASGQILPILSQARTSKRHALSET
jgi:hypothetical protein